MSAIVFTRISSVILTLFCSANCDVLMWGHSRLGGVAPSPLIVFTDDYLNLIVDTLKPDKVIAFIDNGNNRIVDQKLPKLKQLVEGIPSVYVPNNLPLTFDDYSVVILDGTDTEKDNELTKSFEDLENLHGNGRVLAILAPTNPHEIHRRAIDDDADDEKSEPRNEPVLYNREGKAILYSTNRLVLSFNDSGDYILPKKATDVGQDDRQSYLRMVITFVLEDNNKAILRFKFPYNNGYWWLESVELEFGSPTSALKKWILAPNRNMSAPKRFSYHCTGDTVFTNGSVSLTITNMQVQPAPVPIDRFDDAYDCVHFTTVPIWSGLLVTFIMAVVLAVALIMIADIRTMDKFDDPKGRAFSVFVSDQ